MEEVTYGQRAVGYKFNPSGMDEVSQIKLFFAELIDGLDKLRTEAGPGEKGRMLSIAITEAQTSCMWAVKAITRGV